MLHKIISCLFFLTILGYSLELTGQYSWNWKDPVDFNVIDLGDNKLIGYNLIGIGLVSLLDKKKHSDPALTRFFSIGRLHEYQRAPLSSIWTIEGAMGKSFRKYLVLGGGLRFYGMYGDGVHTLGAGGYIWFSWYFINTHSWKFSYTNGVGPNYFFSPFPANGTRFNFTTHYGLRLERMVESRWISVSLMNWHISNADIKGRDRNPAMDAIGIQIGYSF